MSSYSNTISHQLPLSLMSAAALSTLIADGDESFEMCLRKKNKKRKDFIKLKAIIKSYEENYESE